MLSDQECLEVAIKSGNLRIIKRFFARDNIPADILHQAAACGYDEVFWWGVQSLGMSMADKNDKGLLPIQTAIRYDRVVLLEQIAKNTNEYSQLLRPKERTAEQNSYVNMLTVDAIYSANCMQYLHTQCGADLNIIDADGNSLVMLCLKQDTFRSLDYLMIHSSIDLNHANHNKETYFDYVERQVAKYNNDYQAERRFYLRNLRTLLLLNKALTHDDDSHIYFTKLVELSTQQPDDPVIVLALATVCSDDNILCEQYLERAQELAGENYNQIVEFIRNTHSITSLFDEENRHRFDFLKPRSKARGCVIS